MLTASKYELKSLQHACGLHLSSNVNTSPSFSYALHTFEASIKVNEIALSAAMFSYLLRNINSVIKNHGRDRMIHLLKDFIVDSLEAAPSF